MATIRISTEVLEGKDADWLAECLRLIKEFFGKMEQIPNELPWVEHYKTFRVSNQHVPKDDTFVDILVRLDGATRKPVIWECGTYKHKDNK